MEKRIFIASKGTESKTVLFNATENKANMLSSSLAVDTEGMNASDILTVNAVNALTEALTKLTVKDLTNVVDIFVVSNIAKIINNGWYKFWVVTGVDGKGKAIDKRVIEAFKSLDKAMCKKSMYCRIREIGLCRPNGILSEEKYNKLTGNYKANYFYANYLWNLVSPKAETVEPSMPEQTA